MAIRVAEKQTRCFSNQQSGKTMKTLDFVSVQLAARQLHDEEVRRIFGQLVRALSENLNRLTHGLHPVPGQSGPKRFA
jgi:hypothetical protein